MHCAYTYHRTYAQICQHGAAFLSLSNPLDKAIGSILQWPQSEHHLVWLSIWQENAK